MSEVKWIKLSTQMFEDEKIRLIESMPEADTILIIWVKLLAQAGKTNASGYIYLNENIPYTEEMLATIFNRPLNVVRMALRTFQDFGMLEVSDNHFIAISNWEKHQNVDGLEKIREQNRIRKQKQRDKQKSLPMSRDSHGTITQGHATDIDIDKEKDINNNNAQNPFQFFQENIGILPPVSIQEMEYEIKDMGEELVIESIRRAADNGKRTWGYCKAILKNWRESNAKSMDDVKALDAEFNNRPQRNSKKKDIDWEALL